MGDLKTTIILTGSLELSTGRRVRVSIDLEIVGKLTPAEQHEIESARIALHDLTPKVIAS
jgi:hypothetical protein